jgi:hypothetical protein
MYILISIRPIIIGGSKLSEEAVIYSLFIMLKNICKDTGNFEKTKILEFWNFEKIGSVEWAVRSSKGGGPMSK